MVSLIAPRRYIRNSDKSATKFWITDPVVATTRCNAIQQRQLYRIVSAYRRTERKVIWLERTAGPGLANCAQRRPQVYAHAPSTRSRSHKIVGSSSTAGKIVYSHLTYGRATTVCLERCRASPASCRANCAKPAAPHSGRISTPPALRASQSANVR